MIVRSTKLALATLAALTLATAPAPAATPAVGEHPGALELRYVSGADPYGSGFAVPLRGARPGWYTSALRSRVIEAAGRPVAAPADAPLPGAVGIRPGAWQVEPHGCTMNFVFRRGTELAIGTAGHCVGKASEHVVILTLTPGSREPVLVDIGGVVARRNEGVGDDFALVAIRSKLQRWVSPTTALIGGPCGTYQGSSPQLVAHYGHGLAIGTGGTPRVGLALSWRGDSYGWDGLGIMGDSGSPVRLADQRAAGNLTHLVVSDRWLPSHIVGTRIARMQEIAGRWALAASPNCG